ncbi:aminoglycoside phosphotransferase family protein [Desulfopila sp. IMCC35006]|uniref:aminoglycoside phosphotransferase family protein n=1 Tax=Desulfopila sp. IMCC35006 TaxID=2569542 RepID=UPI0010AB7F0D|nr:aminoglycoside phosphotransferase family protein [Desulfopila sp. IMCC35006]TKB25505.1 aminoglycoside phosphotransferase family protein [Desulfopila sp. IMCC35006]
MTASASPFDQYLDPVRHYLRQQHWDDVPAMNGHTFTVSPLAGGEYNLNYLLTSSTQKLVFRVNMASQIDRADQIVYEFKTLQLLQDSGVTPLPVFVDDSRSLIDRGISIMEYLPGNPLDYHLDLAGAARTLSIIHQLQIDEAKNHLIVEKQPLSLIFNECAGLLDGYFNSDLADRAIHSFLLEVKAWAESARAQEQYFLDDPWFCIVNTEINSANFIVNRARQSTHLIDWEMPRWGDPSTDLCHFCSPLTTLWKTDFRFSPEGLDFFIREYKQNIRSAHLQDTLAERMRRKFPFVLLRGISWSAMAWVAYQTGYQGMRNEDTWHKINQYMELDFMRSLFEPFMMVS